MSEEEWDGAWYYIMRTCSQCDGRMMPKRNRREGNLFLGCENYPQCRFTVAYEDGVQHLSERIIELEEQVEHLLAKGPPTRARRPNPSHLKVVHEAPPEESS